MSSSLSLKGKKEVSKQHLVNDLRKIGIGRGDHLAVALSFKSLGFVLGGPETFIDALLETVGPEGTIMMNTHTGGFPVSEIPTDYIFDWQSTRSWTGLIPETLRKRKDAIRSHNPVFSVVAIGKMARTLTEAHNENASLYLPYSKLAEIGGKYLSIGLGYNLVAIRHEPQSRAGLFDVVKLFYGVKFRDNQSKLRLYIFNLPPCRKTLPDIACSLEKKGIVKKVRVGNAIARLCSAREFIESSSSILLKNPQLTLCKNMMCVWCRETERKLNLYGRIENPRYFQKHLWASEIVARINKFRTKKYVYFAFRNGKGDSDLRRGRVSYVLSEFRGFLRNLYLFSRELIFKEKSKVG